MRHALTRTNCRGPRLTHFLSLQVSHSEQVRESMKRVQDNLTAKYPELAEAVVDPESAHLTLMVLKLGDGSMEVSDCAKLLESSIPVLEQEGLLKPITVNLRGLSHFNQKVRILSLLIWD